MWLQLLFLAKYITLLKCLLIHSSHKIPTPLIFSIISLIICTIVARHSNLYLNIYKARGSKHKYTNLRFNFLPPIVSLYSYSFTDYSSGVHLPSDSLLLSPRPICRPWLWDSSKFYLCQYWIFVCICCPTSHPLAKPPKFSYAAFSLPNNITAVLLHK